MRKVAKTMSKNENSKFTPRNNKQDIFSKMAKTASAKVSGDAKAVKEKKESDDESKES